MITSKTKTYGLVAIVLVVSTLGMLLFAWQYVLTQGELVYMKARVVAEHAARERSFIELEKVAEHSELARAQLQSYVLTEDDTVDFLAMLERVALEQQIELSTDSLQVTESETIFNDLHITVSLKGIDAHVDTMLKILETLPVHSYLSSIVRNTHSAASTNMTEAKIVLIVSLIAYDR